jgi:hypothetical protein
VEHVVFFPGPDGPAYRRTASLEDAVRLVEHLRNVEGVAEVSVRPLGPEVPLAFRAWYRVEVPAAVLEPVAEPVAAPVAEPVADAVADPVAAVEPPLADAAPPAEAPLADDVVVPAQVEEPVGAGVNGHAADARSLGFFA